MNCFALCRYGLVATIALMICSLHTIAQDCVEPQLVCGGFSTDTLDTATGLPANVPPGFCFDDAPNALFFEFNTIDTDTYTFLNFNDPSADLFVIIDSCRTGDEYSEGLNIAIFTAIDPCNAATYDDPIACAEDVQTSVQIALTDLEPNTTYYVMVTGIDGPPPATNPTECAIRIGVSGPAVEYDLNAQPPNQTIFPGASAQIEVNAGFAPVEWQGEALSNNTATSVAASPNQVGVYTYNVSKEIDGCIYSDEARVTVVPAIIPYNTFTPNNDGFNDTWIIERIQEWPNAQILVYSRWGAKVFQTTNYRNNWDGDNLPAATYYYVIELNPIEFNAEPITGSVTIIR